MADWTITIPGPPPLWRRPRLARRGRHVAHVTALATRDDEARVAHCARVHCARNGLSTMPAGEPLSLTVRAYYARPQRRPAWCPADVWAAGLPCSRPVTPDADNVAKAVMDGLTKAGAWADDGQVVHIDARTLMAGSGEAARTVVTVRRCGWIVTECHNAG